MRRKLLLAIILGVVAVFTAAFSVGCSKKGNENNSNLNQSTTHNYGEWIIEKQPTCTTIGQKYHVCQDKDCNSLEWEAIPVLGHDFQEHTAKEATCTEVGWEAYQTCSRCEYTTYKEIIPSGHDYENHKAKAATCAEAGWEAYQTC